MNANPRDDMHWPAIRRGAGDTIAARVIRALRALVEGDAADVAMLFVPRSEAPIQWSRVYWVAP